LASVQRLDGAQKNKQGVWGRRSGEAQRLVKVVGLRSRVPPVAKQVWGRLAPSFFPKKTHALKRGVFILSSTQQRAQALEAPFDQGALVA
jgi:hypothetical protein